jgi:molecular chaperone DnaK (HSP70)
MQDSTRYIIGIDLGTTNSVVAYLDTQEASAIQVFQVPQLVAEGEVRTMPTLPSFLYFPSEHDLSAGGMKLPWEERPESVAGVLAREQGALLPGRQVTSAKSWLCHDAVDRRAKLLPWGAEPPEPMVSPVEASARYLTHLRNAWNHSAAASGDAGMRFENQEIVLTVPASFNEEARELTVEAARQAGLERLTLLEEPLAAFYAWIAAHEDALNVAPAARRGGRRSRASAPPLAPLPSRGGESGPAAPLPGSRRETAASAPLPGWRGDSGVGGKLQDGDLVLICDVGGGTSDFSLIRVRFVNQQVQFERIAIGEHLLLGGDNLDLALARRVEEKLHAPKLSLRQRHALGRTCCAAKERLLGDPALDRLPISVLGSGRALVGGTLVSELTRDEVVEVLTGGFLPRTAPDDLPAHERRAGLRELGLPYASEPAITKHLAAFLVEARHGVPPVTGESVPAPMVRPDAILFNGGFFTPAITRDKIVEAVEGWFNGSSAWRPKILSNQAPESAVAIGAAYYGRVRRGGGLRIRAGSARSYYIGVQSEGAQDHAPQAVCVLPSGIEEGTTLPLESREFAVLTNRPVSFTLYSSTTRHDEHGEVAVLDEAQIHRHAPLVTLLRFGKKSRQIELGVRLTASFTEVGTLELWCESLKTQHRWRLQFELRGNEAQPPEAAAPSSPAPPPIPGESVETAAKLIQEVFGSTHVPRGHDARATLDATTAPQPETIVNKLEAALGHNKDAWPMGTIRSLCDVLIEGAAGRAKSRRHEARWLNLFGFCLRPGFGALLDDWRINQARRVYLAGPSYARDPQVQVEWLVLWRRVAGGLNAGQQRELYQKYGALLGVSGKKTSGRLNSQVEHEGWRLLASLEHLPAPWRASLGEELFARINNEPTDKAWLWSLGRVGARIPLYGPLNCVVAVETASKWLKALLELSEFTAETASAIVQLGSLTGDRLRDIDQELREKAIARLSAAGISDDLSRGLQQYVPPARADAMRIFGESLPEGLRLVG